MSEPVLEVAHQILFVFHAMRLAPLLLLTAFCAANLHPALAPSAFVPVVIWHGLGDSYNSPGLLSLKHDLEMRFEGIFVHLIGVSRDRDSQGSFFGDTRTQIDQVCSQLSQIDELNDAFDAVGFSQGGQLLRGLIERCNTISVRNLITLGAQQ